MRFSSRKGRPKVKEDNGESRDYKVRDCKDLGTPELCLRRAFNLTTEALDICRDRKILSEAQHNAALHFRWLYTIRFGAPNISAFDINKGLGRDIRFESDDWRMRREREYSMAVEKLRARGALKIVMNIAIFNHQPRFLTGVSCHETAQAIQNSKDLAKFREGLRVLVSLWPKPNNKPNNMKSNKSAEDFNKILS